VAYTPDRGEVVWLSFDPQAGHEQAGHRLALVLSPKRYNQVTSLMLCCPLTTAIKGYPFEVQITVNATAGVALADQVKSLDWRARRAKKAAMVKPGIVDEVLGKIQALLFSAKK
jgi:mRNA interferase MazF